MEELHLNNVPTLTISEIVSMLSESYVSYIENGIKFKDFPSIMLWGAPGVGKSQSVRQIAKNIQDKTGKEVNVIDVRLLLFNPIDLRGIPTTDKDKQNAIWLKPKIFDMNASEDVINILFLDEISSCTPAVQAAAYQITLDRTIGEHKLPDNCIVIAAGNRMNDKSVVSKMPKALANRLMHIEVEIDIDSWIKWVKENKLNSIVIRFIEDNKKCLMVDNQYNENLAYATPRTWEMVSRILNNVKCSNYSIEPLIAGLVGKDVALELMRYVVVNGDIPKANDIFNGKVEYKELTETQYEVLKNTIINYAEVEKDNIDKIVNSVKFVLNMPYDYAIFILKHYCNLSDEIKAAIESMPEFKEWFKQVQNKNEKI